MSGAEVILGVVAGGAGLASLSIQPESAKKLKRLYHSMKNAPETLKEIADEIELMSLSLKHLERHRQSESHGIDLLDRCIETCRSRTTKINLLTETISEKLKKASLVGRLYAARQERDLDKLLRELDHARSALHLAVTLYHKAEEDRRWEIQQGEITRQREQTAMVRLAVQAARAVQEDHHTGLLRELQMEPCIRRRRIHEVQETYDGSERREDEDKPEEAREPSAYRHRNAPEAPTGRFRIKLPALFSSRVWDIAHFDAKQGWDLRFRTYNVRPWDSPIFRCCRKGDLEGVKNLVRNGDASLLDICPEGKSLIEMSIVSFPPTPYTSKADPT